MKTNSVLVTPPAREVIGLEQLKTFLRVQGSAEDDLLTLQLRAVTQRLEALTDKKFVTQTWDVFLDDFPKTYKGRDEWWEGVKEGAIHELYKDLRYIELPFGPMQSVTGLFTYDEDDTEYEFNSSSYSVDTAGGVGRLALKSSNTWPTTILRPLNGVRIRAVFGYGEGYIPAVGETPAVASLVPSDIQEAVKQMVAVTYEHRGDELPKIPPNVAMLLEPYRRFKVGY